MEDHFYNEYLKSNQSDYNQWDEIIRPFRVAAEKITLGLLAEINGRGWIYFKAGKTADGVLVLRWFGNGYQVWFTLTAEKADDQLSKFEVKAEVHLAPLGSGERVDPIVSYAFDQQGALAGATVGQAPGLLIAKLLLAIKNEKMIYLL
jgi:hypothetical protein